MNSRDITPVDDVKTQNHIVYLSVNEQGTILEYNSVTQLYLDQNGFSFDTLLPHDHTSIVEYCITTGVGIRNKPSENNKINLVWDYYPLPEHGCVHIYGTPACDGTVNPQLFQSIVESGIHIVAICEADGTIRFINKAIEDHMGVSTEEMKGRNAFSFVHPEDRPYVEEQTRLILETEEPFITVVFRAQIKDGSWRYFESTARNMSHDPLIKGILINAQEITGRNKMCDKFCRREYEFRQFIDNAADAIIVYDKNRKIQYTNQMAVELLGYRKADLNGMNIEKIFPSGHLNKIPLLNATPVKDRSVIFERMIHRSDGHTIEVESSEQMLPDGRYQLIIRDISKRKSNDKEFRKAIKSEIYEKLFIKLRLFKHGEGMLMNLNRLALFVENTALLQKRQVYNRFKIAAGEFQKIIYPELNSIGKLLQALHTGDVYPASDGLLLPKGNSIINLSTSFKKVLETIDRSIEEDDWQTCISVIRENRSKIRRTITDIKKVITDTSQMIEKHFTCHVAESIRTIVKKYQSEQSNVKIKLTDTISDQAAIMNCAELGEVMDILIENSLDVLEAYTSKNTNEDFKPAIDIMMTVLNNNIRIEIKDNGPGIPEEYRNFVFKEGFSTKGPGHGFGLSYSQKCITKYGGRIFYEHRRERGACFVIELLRAYNG